jgi:hypothetical protein
LQTWWAIVHLHIQKIPCYVVIDGIALVPKLASADPTHRISVESKLPHLGQLSADLGPIFY